MNKLNITNPQQLLYENQLLKITVLGGIRIEGLDRMRTTLKIQLKTNNTEVDNGEGVLQGIAIRHNLDLYNDTQVEKLIRKTATKLEIGSSVIEASINELIEQLENYRLNEIEKQDVRPKRQELTKQEQKEALALLQNPNLLQITNELIGKSGIVGEQTNRLIMYLIMSSRKRDQPLHIVSLGSSGTGKTHLQESIGNLIPTDEKLEITTLSENAFYYFGQQELKHKVILIEDLDGIMSAMYPLRELQSKRKISKTIAFKNTKGDTSTGSVSTINLTVEGPICVAGCTTQEQIYEDNANRSFLIYLDESETQDLAIMNYQRRIASGNINEVEQIQAKQLLQNSQQLLENIKVINPYAEYLQLPKEVLKKRRTNAHYLQFIEVVTYYHQHQREKQVDKETGEMYIETTIQDIEQTNELLKEILLHKSDVLNGATRNYLENLKNYLKENGKDEFTNAEIRKYLQVKETTLRRYHKNLQTEYLIKKIHNPETKSYTYKIINEQEYQELKTVIDNTLDECLAKAQVATTPPTRQKLNGEDKTKKINNLKPVATKTTKKDKRTVKIKN